MGRTFLSTHQRQFLSRYWHALKHSPEIFRRTAFRRRTLEEELHEALLRGSLRKAFGLFDLLCLGLGIVIGSGWGQLTGVAAMTYAGPAVILSYVFGGLATLLTAACFAELCMEYPVSGGAFSYVMVTFGELAAFVSLGGLLLEYALGMAAVARGFSRFLARLCNANPLLFTVELDAGADQQYVLDFMAAGVVLFMSLLLSIGVRESALFITSVTCVKLVLIVFVCIMGYTRGTIAAIIPPPFQIPANSSILNSTTQASFVEDVIRGPVDPWWHPSYGVDGVFLGAAVLFFTYVGWDAICNAAEEARNVTHLPLALMGTACTSATLYILLALSLVLMTRPNVIAPDLPNTEGDNLLTVITAFVFIQNMKWMQYVTAITLLLGIITALTVGLFSASRIVMAASRDWLLPPFLARISKRTQTPLLAQMVLGVIIALLAMFVEVEAATGMVSFGTLVALLLVCNAQLYRRYYPDVQLRFTRWGGVEIAPKQELGSWAPGKRFSLPTRKKLVGVHLLLLNAVCVGLGIYYNETSKETPTNPSNPDEALGHSGFGCIYFAAAWLLVTLSLQLCCPLEYRPEGWHVPWWLMPWLPSAAIALVIFSVSALPDSDYWKTGVFFGSLAVFYMLFSLPMSYIKHNCVDSAADELNVVELSFVDGRWQPSQLGTMLSYASSIPHSILPARPSAARSSGLWKGEPLGGRHSRASVLTSNGTAPSEGSTAGSAKLTPAASGASKLASVGEQWQLPPVAEGPHGEEGEAEASPRAAAAAPSAAGAGLEAQHEEGSGRENGSPSVP